MVGAIEGRYAGRRWAANAASVPLLTELPRGQGFPSAAAMDATLAASAGSRGGPASACSGTAACSSTAAASITSTIRVEPPAGSRTGWGRARWRTGGSGRSGAVSAPPLYADITEDRSRRSTSPPPPYSWDPEEQNYVVRVQVNIGTVIVAGPYGEEDMWWELQE